MFHEGFRVGITQSCTFCPNSPSLARYRENLELERVTSCNSGQQLVMKTSGEIMAHMFGLEDHCPWQKLGAVYCRKLYGKPYMNTGYAHKAMYAHRSDDYLQAFGKSYHEPVTLLF